jgi:hypothetical protein
MDMFRANKQPPREEIEAFAVNARDVMLCTHAE